MGFESQSVVPGVSGQILPLLKQPWQTNSIFAFHDIILLRCSQAVIGAGAAGLATAKELLAEGHSVVVFEQVGRESTDCTLVYTCCKGLYLGIHVLQGS